MMRTILNAIRTEGISVSSGVDIRTDVENINISFPNPFPYQLDGDYLGEQTSLHIEHRQDALRLVKPIIV
jgi:diacylglycerol kinase family enzyme